MKSRRLFFHILLLIFGTSFLHAQDAPSTEPPIPPPEVIEKQLEDAEKRFKRAQEMFNPWYSGPLLTGSASVIAPGHYNISPYLFVTDNHAKYNKHGKPKDISDLISVNPVLSMQFGMLKWLSSSLNVQAIYNKQKGHDAFNVGDTAFGLNFRLLKESPYNPGIRISVTETFPTGKYQRLSSHKGGVDATGAGSYQTTFSFNVAKVVWWLTTHPMDFRVSFNYTIPSNVHVKGFNTYGGGFGTHGTVNPGNSFSGNFGYEFSFTQRWVAALDVVYNYAWKTKFSGHSGVDSAGAPASVGGPFSEQLSLAPALEYNPSANMSFTGGVWFTVWGRNSLDFVSGILNFSYTF